MSNKFKVGDIVKAIDNQYGITSLEQNWIGEVTKVHEDGIFDAKTLKCDYEFHNPNEVYDNLEPSHFKLVNDRCKLSIHVTTDGKTTYAVLKDGKKVVKRTEARCCPDDKFKFDMGAAIAVNRLLDGQLLELNQNEPRKSKFIPHLEGWNFGKPMLYGNIGEPTNLVDNKGNELFVGDVVDLYYSKSGEYRGERPVCANDRYTQFVMGIVDNCQPDSSCRKNWIFVHDEVSDSICGCFELACPEKAIAIVQKWSDEHPPKTIMQDFFEKYPNAPKHDDGTPRLCAKYLGYESLNCALGDDECVKCWNQPMEEKP